MQSGEIERLDPHYATEMGFARNEAIRNLHNVTTQLNNVVDEKGQFVDTDKNLALFYYIRQYLKLDRMHEAFFEARLLPPHDSFIAEDGRSVPSHFLVVDARNPYDDSEETQPNPRMQIRAYFLLLGEDLLSRGDGSSICPYYVVSDREITSEGTDHEEFNNASHVFYVRHDGEWPLDAGIEPSRINDRTEPYEIMGAELQLALDRLTEAA